MKKSASHLFAAASLATAAFVGAPSPAAACGYYQPGLLEWLAGPYPVRPAPCVYQGDRIAEQGPDYDGPAAIHPQPVCRRSLTDPHGLYQPGVAVAPRETVMRGATVRRATRTTTGSKGKP